MKPAWLEKFRHWLDDTEASFEINPKPKPLSQAEHLFIIIAREVEAAMCREAFTPYGEPTYIPRHYLVFLGAEDDQAWHGEKRRGMERGLHNAVRERALELVGKQHLQADSITLELRVDATLGKGQVRVQAVWDEVEKQLSSAKRATARWMNYPPMMPWQRQKPRPSCCNSRCCSNAVRRPSRARSLRLP